MLGKQRQIQVAPGILRLFVPQKVGGKGGAAHQKVAAGTDGHIVEMCRTLPHQHQPVSGRERAALLCHHEHQHMVTLRRRRGDQVQMAFCEGVRVTHHAAGDAILPTGQWLQKSPQRVTLAAQHHHVRRLYHRIEPQ